MNGISSSTLTNLLHKIVVQPSSIQKDMPLDPSERTNQTETTDREKDSEKHVTSASKW